MPSIKIIYFTKLKFQMILNGYAFDIMIMDALTNLNDEFDLSERNDLIHDRFNSIQDSKCIYFNFKQIQASDSSSRFKHQIQAADSFVFINVNE